MAGMAEKAEAAEKAGMAERTEKAEKAEKAERMDIYQLIDALEDLVDEGLSIPMSGKCVVGRDEIHELARRLRLAIPDDVKAARKVLEDREQTLKKAEVDAKRIVKDAEAMARETVGEHEIINAAKNSAREIRLNAYEYVEDLMGKASDAMRVTLDTINANRTALSAYKDKT
jgi:hypothetical protein